MINPTGQGTRSCVLHNPICAAVERLLATSFCRSRPPFAVQDSICLAAARATPRQGRKTVEPPKCGYCNTQTTTTTTTTISASSLEILGHTVLLYYFRSNSGSSQQSNIGTHAYSRIQLLCFNSTAATCPSHRQCCIIRWRHQVSGAVVQGWLYGLEEECH